MKSRTIAIGDIHGDLPQLEILMERLPVLDGQDTLIFLGDYVDRGPQSAGVIEFIRRQLPARTAAKIVCLRGNHEDAWLRVIREGWPEFVHPMGNGCRECLHSYVGTSPENDFEAAARELKALHNGSFFPAEVVQWMRALPFWYEDDRAIYVHAGLPHRRGRYVHPSEAEKPEELAWARDMAFFRDYRGKTVVCGHTPTSCLPPELSSYTPGDIYDLWKGPNVIAIDTACGKPGGFLTAVELPSFTVYEAREGSVSGSR